MRPNAHGAALGMVAVPVPVASPPVFVVTNDNVLPITNTTLGRHGDRSRKRRSAGGA